MACVEVWDPAWSEDDETYFCEVLRLDDGLYTVQDLGEEAGEETAVKLGRFTI